MYRVPLRTILAAVLLYADLHVCSSGNSTEDSKGFFYHTGTRANELYDSPDGVITLITQLSPDRIGKRLTNLAREWAGPISLAVYIHKKDDLAILDHKLVNDKHLASLTDVHIYVENSKQSSPPYPINKLRNIALLGASMRRKDGWVFILDADARPSFNMNLAQRQLNSALDLGNGPPDFLPFHERTAFVIPAFESTLRNQEKILKVKNKHQLRKSMTVGEAIIMHADYFPASYVGPLDPWDWALAGSPYEVKYTSRWEPYFFARLPIPLFDERFVDRGLNKAQHQFTMFSMGYRYIVMPEMFISDAHVHSASSGQRKIHFILLDKLWPMFVQETLDKVGMSCEARVRQRRVAAIFEPNCHRIDFMPGKSAASGVAMSSTLPEDHNQYLPGNGRAITTSHCHHRYPHVVVFPKVLRDNVLMRAMSKLSNKNRFRFLRGSVLFSRLYGMDDHETSLIWGTLMKLLHDKGPTTVRNINHWTNITNDKIRKFVDCSSTNRAGMPLSESSKRTILLTLRELFAHVGGIPPLLYPIGFPSLEMNHGYIVYITIIKAPIDRYRDFIENDCHNPASPWRERCYHNHITRFFCDRNPVCTALNNHSAATLDAKNIEKRALEAYNVAKEVVKHNFLFVGSLQYPALSFRTLECLLPKYFGSATELLFNAAWSDEIHSKNTTLSASSGLLFGDAEVQTKELFMKRSFFDISLEDYILELLHRKSQDCCSFVPQ